MAWDLFAPPGVIRQLDGSVLGGKNCAAATAAMHIVSERQGRRTAKGSPWPPTGASFRAATGDDVGGLLASQVDATSNRVYGIDPDFQIASATKVAQLLREGYGVSYLHAHGPIVDAGFEGSAGFRGNHSAFSSQIRGVAREIRLCDPLYDGRRASIPRGPQWVPWSAWVRAGELLVVGPGGLRMMDRYGRGMLYVGLTRIPYRPSAPVVSLRYSVAFSGAAFWLYDVVAGRIPSNGRHARAFNGPTSAPCGPPAVYPWDGHVSRRLVRVTAGVLKGQYVAVPQGSVRLITTEVAA